MQHMKPAPSAPALQPNTSYMSQGKYYGKGVPSAPPLTSLKGFTPGWSYTNYAKRESEIVPVELRTAPNETAVTHFAIQMMRVQQI